MTVDAEVSVLRRLVWQAHQAAQASEYLPALGWADLADQAWRLILEHPDRRERLAALAHDYAAHALDEAGPLHARTAYGNTTS